MRNLMRELEENSRQKEILPYSKRRNEMLLKVCPSLRGKVLKALLGFRTILGNDLTDYQKLCLLYQMLCEGGTYDYGDRKKSLSYSYLGALKGLAVCSGFADLFTLLVGECTDSYDPYRISGYIAEDLELVEANDTGHAWIIIKDKTSNKAWHFDPTWDLGKKQYRYFAKTDNEMKGRIWATKYLPVCAEKLSGRIYSNKARLTRLVDYYKSMPQRFESGDFTTNEKEEIL